MHTVAEVASAAETRVLVDDPDGRLGRVEALRPGDDGLVQILDLRVVVAEPHRDDLSHLASIGLILDRHQDIVRNYVRRSSY